MADQTLSLQDQSIISPSSTAEYAKSCEIGRAYAAQFMQSLKDKPYLVGANQLGTIASKFDFTDETASAGLMVGFFSHLEQYIFAGAQHASLLTDLHNVNHMFTVASEGDQA